MSLTTLTTNKTRNKCEFFKQSKQRRLYARYYNYLYTHFTQTIPREPSSLLECLQCSFCETFSTIVNERHVCDAHLYAWPRLLLFILKNTPNGYADEAWLWMMRHKWFFNCSSLRILAHRMALQHNRRDFSKLFATWGQCDTGRQYIARDNIADEILEILNTPRFQC